MVFFRLANNSYSYFFFCLLQWNCIFFYFWIFYGFRCGGYESCVKFNINLGIDYLVLRKFFNQSEIDYLRDKIMNFMYIELGIIIITMFFVIIYFFEKLKLLLSVIVVMGRLEFKIGVKNLLKNGQFWLLVFIYGMGIGVYGGWCSILDFNFLQFYIDQKIVGWLGFGVVVVGLVLGIFFLM